MILHSVVELGCVVLLGVRKWAMAKIMEALKTHQAVEMWRGEAGDCSRRVTRVVMALFQSDKVVLRSNNLQDCAVAPRGLGQNVAVLVFARYLEGRRN